jgi:hypothetical protein
MRWSVDELLLIERLGWVVSEQVFIESFREDCRRYSRDRMAASARLKPCLAREAVRTHLIGPGPVTDGGVPFSSIERAKRQQVRAEEVADEAEAFEGAALERVLAVHRSLGRRRRGKSKEASDVA